jgi:hypothetical protein
VVTILRRALVPVTIAVLGATVLGACAQLSAIKKAVHTVEANKSTIDAFTQKVQSAEASPFEAKYMTTGASPTSILYAVDPPTGLSFQETPSGSSSPSADVIVNSSGEYSCAPPSTSGPVSCQKLGTATAAEENKIFDFYTPSHWVTFLQDFSLAAGFAGDKVTSSTMTVNGFAMQCVDFVAPGVAGTSTICTTSQGILGYVQVASDSTNFEIVSYSASPASSLFQLPPGATVTTVPPSSSTTNS